MELLQRPAIKQFIKFGVVGFASFLIDFGLYALFTRVFGVYYLVAKVSSFCIAAVNSYLLNRAWTFRSRDPDRVRQGLQFLVVASIGAGLNASIMYVLHGRLRIHDLVAFVIATVLVMFWNFLINRAWTFRHRPE
jgi:putative flippase GtrA